MENKLGMAAAPGAIALLVALVELLSLPNSLGAHLTGRFWSLVEVANDHFELLGIAPRHSSTGTPSHKQPVSSKMFKV